MKTQRVEDDALQEALEALDDMGSKVREAIASIDATLRRTEGERPRCQNTTQRRKAKPAPARSARKLAG